MGSKNGVGPADYIYFQHDTSNQKMSAFYLPAKESDYSGWQVGFQ